MRTLPKKPDPKKAKDPLKQIKFFGYVRAQVGLAGTVDLQDLVRFAKFYLCFKTNTLWKSPIWDEYTDEEILSEYYARLYFEDEDLRRAFEATLGIDDDAVAADYAWLEGKAKASAQQAEDLSKDLPAKIEFVPTDEAE